MTERVPGCNQCTNVQTCRCLRPLSLASLASSPIGGAKGGCAAGFAPSYPLRRRFNDSVISMRWAGNARPLALPLGELARLKAVTERVDCTRWL